MSNLKPQDKTELAGSLNFVPYRCFIRCCFGLEYDTYMSLGFPSLAVGQKFVLHVFRSFLKLLSELIFFRTKTSSIYNYYMDFLV